MSVKTFPTVLDFLLNIEGFIIIYKISIISMLKIFIELRVSGILVFVKKHIFEERYSIYGTGKHNSKKGR